VPLQHKDVVKFATFSPDGRWVVTASSDNTARVWDARTGQPISPPLQHQDAVSSASFSPDGKWAVTASDDKTARVWDAQSGQPISPPLEHQDPVFSGCFSPNGKRVATASEDNTARVWDAETGQPISPPLEHRSMVRSASFSPDGRRVVTASDDKTASIWDIAPETTPPEWLPDVLEAYVFQYLDESGTPRIYSAGNFSRIRAERLASTSDDPWEVFGRWLFSDPETRTISPWSSVTVPEYVQRLIAERTPGSLDEAESLSYGEGDVQKQIEAMRATLPEAAK
jgi:WD40 repeat protein